MPLTETGQPAPLHLFTEPEEARRAIHAGIEYLIEVDGYTPEDIRSNLIDGALAEYEEES